MEILKAAARNINILLYEHLHVPPPNFTAIIWFRNSWLHILWGRRKEEKKATKTFSNVSSVLNPKGRFIHFILKGQAAKCLSPKQIRTF